MLGRMRLDGLTETAVPFAERTVLLWRRGAPAPDMDVDILISILQVGYCLTFCAEPLRMCSECTSPPR